MSKVRRQTFHVRNIMMFRVPDAPRMGLSLSQIPTHKMPMKRMDLDDCLGRKKPLHVGYYMRCREAGKLSIKAFGSGRYCRQCGRD